MAKTERIVRYLTVFEKKGAEKLLKEIEANNLSLSFIRQIFKAKNDDPNLYRPYKVTKVGYAKITQRVPELKEYPLSSYDIYLETFIE